MVNIMNNEINQNTIQNTQVPVVPQTPVTPQPMYQQPIQQVQPQQVQQQQPQTLAQMVQQANEKANQPVDYESLSPKEKQQLIDKAIRDAELKCRSIKPKPWKGLISICIFLILLCVAFVVVLNVLN